MPSPAESLLCRIRSLVADAPEPADADLLQQFVRHRDEFAFTTIVRRHGPMVLRVCRRVLSNPADADDAFQATFLVLARKADSVRPAGALPAWLHGVAHRAALKARDAARRRAASPLPADCPTPDRGDPLEELSVRECLGLLDAEIAQLPEVYRLPVILCCLEGLTQDEAATRLGWSAGSVKGRLERGRARLHARLARRGLTLSAALGCLEAARATPIHVAASLVRATVAAGMSAVGGVAVALPEPVLRLAADAPTGSASWATAGVAVVLLGLVAGALLLHPMREAARPEMPDEARPAAPRAEPAKDVHGDALPDGAAARLGTARWRHEGEAASVAFSHDGKTTAASSAEAIYLWETATGRRLAVIKVPRISTAYFNSPIAFSPDGKLLAWTDDSQVHLRELASGKEVGLLSFPRVGVGGPRYTLRFSPDGTLLVWSGAAGGIVWDVASGKQRYALGDQQTYFGDLCFSPDGKTLATATQTPAVKLWDVATGKQLRGIDAHERFAMAVAFSPDGKRVASAGRSSMVISETASGRELARWKTPKDWVLTMAFTPDGKTLVACTEDAKVRLWDVSGDPPAGKERQVLEGGWIGRSMALSPDGKTVAMGTSQSTLRVWDVTTGRSLLPEGEAHDAAVHAVAFSPDGKLLVSGGENRQLRIWDAATGRHLRRLDASAGSLSFSPDGRRLASAWIWDSTARVWDVATGKELLKLPHDGAGEVAGVAFTAGGGLASVSWKRDGDRSPGSARLQSWDASGRPLRAIELPKSRPQCLAVSPDGRWAAVGSLPHPAWLCDLQRGKILTSLHGQEKVVTAVAFSADGRTMITGSTDRAVRLWETATGKEIRALGRPERPVTAVAFAPDGRRVASGEGDRNPDGTSGPPSIRVWDAATGRELQTLRGYEADVLGLAFSPDGRRLAAGLKDSTVLIWDAKTQPPALAAAAPEELDGLWSDLENADAGRADRAAWALAATPDKAVALLERRLKPAASPQSKQVKQRLGELDSDDFATRDAAAATLSGWGGAVEAELRAALDRKPSAEVRRRAEALLAALDAPPSGEVLRSLRAVRVLERVGTAQARRVLETLAGGESAHRVTAEAKAALGRLNASP